MTVQTNIQLILFINPTSKGVIMEKKGDLEKSIRSIKTETFSEISVIATEPLSPNILKQRLDKIFQRTFKALLAIAQEVDKKK